MAGELVAGGRALAAGRGWEWIAAAWRLFTRQPWLWVGFGIVLLVVFVLLLVLHPVVGRLLVIALGPIFMGGVVLGCRSLEEGRALEFAHLFAGFRTRFAPLATVGAASAIATAVIAVATVLASGVNPFVARTSEQFAALPPAEQLAILLALLVILALLMPVAMAAWFAPPLVLLHARSATQAMKESFVACLRNVAPMLVYGLVLLVLAIVATLPLLAGWLVLGPVLAASVYTAYKDVFIAA